MPNREGNIMSRRTNQHRSRPAFIKYEFDLLETRDLPAVIIYNPPGSAQPEQQKYPIAFYNPSAAAQTFNVSVVRSGAGDGSLDRSSFMLAGNQHAVVTFTPTADSSHTNDVQIRVTGAGASLTDFLTVAKVTLPLDIRQADTPNGMTDRIAPRIPVSETVTVSPSLVGTDPIYVEISGQGNGHGTASVNSGNYPVAIQQTTTIKLLGVTQTAATGGKDARKLHLTVTTTPLGQSIIQSAGFSVAAIPIGYQESFYQAIDAQHIDPRSPDPKTGPLNNRGFAVLVTPLSDSGELADLNGIDISEQVQYVDSPNSVFIHDPLLNSSYLPAIVPPPNNVRGDFHTIPASTVRKPGGMETVYQTHIFRDHRTGGTDIPIDKSGFVIKRSIYSTNAGWLVTTTEIAAVTKANGFASTAGKLINSDNGGSTISVTASS